MQVGCKMFLRDRKWRTMDRWMCILILNAMHPKKCSEQNGLSLPFLHAKQHSFRFALQICAMVHWRTGNFSHGRGSHTAWENRSTKSLGQENRSMIREFSARSTVSFTVHRLWEHETVIHILIESRWGHQCLSPVVDPVELNVKKYFVHRISLLRGKVAIAQTLERIGAVYQL